MIHAGDGQLAIKTSALEKRVERRFSASFFLLPLVTSLILLIPTVFYWAHERAVWAEFQQSRVAQFRLRLSKRFQSEIEVQLRPLRRLSDEISTGDVISAPSFAASARSVIREDPTLKYVAWMTLDGKLISEASECSRSSKGSSAQLLPLLRRLTSESKGSLISTSDPGEVGASDRIIVLPIIDRGNGYGRDPAIAGAIVTSKTTQNLLGTLLPPDASAPFIVEVKDEQKQLVFASEGAATPQAEALLRTADVDQIPVLDQSWSMSVAAAPPGLGRRPSDNAGAFLISGLIVALLGGATVAQAARHRRREQRRTQAHLSALEALHAAAASISARPRSEGEIFERLLEAACRLLHMPIALLVQLDAGNRVRLTREIGFQPPLDWEYRNLSELPIIGQCAASGELVTVEGFEANPPSSPHAVMDRRNIVSMLVLPLAAGEDRIGFMALCDEKPRRFSDEELRLARLWASQAAVIMANHRLTAANDEALAQQQRLNQQVRNDADAKAMLLRELNHRVKNNLAGIVGLLSAGVPELSKQAQQWLDRAIARIETLARAHELFVGDSSELGLADLIGKTLEPICAMKPAGVHIELDLGAVNDPLGTDQAVTVAMVLNELASNALQHGLGERGTLRVRTSRPKPNWAMIEMIDDGTSGAATDEVVEPATNTGDGYTVATLTPRGTHTGIGLQLVRGLVGRELHGIFSLRENAAGGTVATVEFPIGSQATAAIV